MATGLQPTSTTIANARANVGVTQDEFEGRLARNVELTALSSFTHPDELAKALASRWPEVALKAAQILARVADDPDTVTDMALNENARVRKLARDNRATHRRPAASLC